MILLVTYIWIQSLSTQCVRRQGRFFAVCLLSNICEKHPNTSGTGLAFSGVLGCQKEKYITESR